MTMTVPDKAHGLDGVGIPCATLKRERKLFRIRLQPFLILAGLIGIVWLCGRIGWLAIRANIALIGKWFFVLVVLFLFAQMAFMAGWWVLIGSRTRRKGPLPFCLFPPTDSAGDPLHDDYRVCRWCHQN